MKKLTLLITVLVAILTQASAQQKNYTETMDSLFSNISKIGITTGILYDRIFPSAALHVFNSGVIDTSSNEHFRQAWLELYRAAYINTSMLNPDSLSNRARQKLNTGIVPLGLLNYKFNYIDTMALENNSLYYVGHLFYDVTNRTQSPFIERNVTVIAPLTDSAYNTEGIRFQLPSNLIITNTGLSVSSIQVDFDNGTGIQNISLDQVIYISYNSFGLKTIKFIITYSDSSQITTYATLNLKEDLEQNTLRSFNCNGRYNPDIEQIVATIPYQGAGESTPILGEGLATIYYHTTDCDKVLKKPIIIIDGFDPGSAHHPEPYIWDHLNYSSTKNFGEEMLDKGYDIIMLDYNKYNKGGKNIDGGSDYIQRNAFTLIKLIQWVNANKANNGEELVVIGPSMGGLISRYALAYMEQNSMPHNTRLWVSFDSPHLGANIPIGDQWLLWYMGEVLGIGAVKEKLDGKLNTPAAKQMLIHHYSSNSVSPAASSLRTSFMNELNTLGYPTQLRKIALINGAGNGLTQNIFGQTSLKFQYKPTVVTRILTGAISFFTGKFFLRILTGGLSASSNYLSTQAYFTPGYNGSGKVFEGSVFNGVLINRTKYASSPTNSIGLDNSPGGYFNAQQEIADGIMEKLNHGVVGWFLKPKITDLVNTHAFILAKSSLAVSSGSNFGEDYSFRSLVCTGETPFDSYFTPSNNEDHVSLTDKSVDYITKEIDGIPQLPLIKSNLTISGLVQQGGSTTYSVANLPAGATVKWEVTSPYAINGSNTANPVAIVIPSNNSQFAQLIATVSTNCYQIIVTKQLVPPNITAALSGSNGACGEGYATINVPSGVQFTWTATGDISIEGQGKSYTTTSNTINVTGTNGLLTCKFLSFNNVVTTYKEYAPYSKVINVTANPMLNSDPLSASILNVDYSYASIKWYIDGTLVYTGNDSLFDTALPDCGNHVLSAEAELSCGATVSIGSIEIERYCGSWFRNMVIYPNPAISTNLFVSPDETKMARGSLVEKGKMKEYEAWLYDGKGTLKKKSKSQNLKIELNTTNLPSGTYFLHMLMEGTREMIIKQIIIRN
jgi:hypothetical protein